MSKIHTHPSDEICAQCGEEVEIKCKLNSKRAGVFQYKCIECDYFSPWTCDPSIKPWIETQSEDDS